MAADQPQFPPGYTVRLCPDDPFTTAVAAAEDGADDGLLLWQDRRDAFNAALVLRPLDPIAVSLQLAYVAQLGLLDGLAAVAPPETDVELAWPDRLLVNGACAGGIRVVHGKLVEKQEMSDVPDWLALGLYLQLQGNPYDDAPGVDLEYTNLFEEGCGDVTAAMLIEAFSRHFLKWLDRWLDQGWGDIRKRYAEELGDEDLTVDESGDAWQKTPTGQTRRSLREALRRPSWVRPMVGNV